MQRSSVGPSRHRWIATLTINILPFTTKVKQRLRPAQRNTSLELEVIFCVYGVLSPVLANVVLDEMDWELHRRAHRFARYADDCNIAVKSERAGQRVMRSVTRWLEDSLRLTVNTRKIAVDRPWNRKFLGFTLSRRDKSLKVADAAIGKLKDRVRELSRRTRGQSLSQIVAELRTTLLGWKAYFGITEVLSPLRDLDKWIRRRLRCYAWKQWGSRGYRELRKRGVSVREAWHVSKSAHGPWRISQTPALSVAIANEFLPRDGLATIGCGQGLTRMHSTQRTAVYVTRTHGGVGGRGREVPSYPDSAS